MPGPIQPVPLILILSILLTLDYVSVGLRFWGRFIQCKYPEFNDYMIVLGLVSRPSPLFPFIYGSSME